MQLITASIAILNQLESVVRQLDQKEFCAPSHALSGSSVGQHLRHTLEFFLCLEQGFASGIVNYDRRAHDKLIEADKAIALAAIERIKNFVANQKRDEALRLEVGYERNNDDAVQIATTYFRELTYNIEHAVHHMAIMKIGIREVAPSATLPADFGVAVSTVRYRESALETSR